MSCALVGVEVGWSLSFCYFLYHAHRKLLPGSTRAWCLCWQRRSVLYLSVSTKDPCHTELQMCAVERGFKNGILQLKQLGCEAWIKSDAGFWTPLFCFNNAVVVGLIPCSRYQWQSGSKSLNGDVCFMTDVVMYLYRFIVSFITCAHLVTKILNLVNNNNNTNNNNNNNNNNECKSRRCIFDNIDLSRTVQSQNHTEETNMRLMVQMIALRKEIRENHLEWPRHY